MAPSPEFFVWSSVDPESCLLLLFSASWTVAKTHPSSMSCWRKNHGCYLIVSGASWQTYSHRSCGPQRGGEEIGWLLPINLCVSAFHPSCLPAFLPSCLRKARVLPSCLPFFLSSRKPGSLFFHASQSTCLPAFLLFCYLSGCGHFHSPISRFLSSNCKYTEGFSYEERSLIFIFCALISKCSQCFPHPSWTHSSGNSFWLVL